jgi:hypothetical protein
MKLINILPIASLALLCSCSKGPMKYFLTDAATRLAFEIESAALRLESSNQTEMELKHKPAKFPEGVPGDYSIRLRPTKLVPHPREPDQFRSRSLAVNKYHTTYHCRFVSVPETLQIEKKAGEPTHLLLKKTNKPWNYTKGGKTLRGNKTIEIVSLR